jgi:hypothetical protein
MPDFKDRPESALLDDPHAYQALQERLLKDKSSLRTTLALLIAGEVSRPGHVQ